MKIKNRKFFDLLIFEGVYRLFSILIILPILNFMFDILSDITGYGYISFNIVIHNLSDYKIWPVIIMMTIIVSMFVLCEIYISMIIFYRKNNTAFSIRSIVYRTLQMGIGCFNLKKIWIFFISLYMGVFSFLYNGFIGRVRMPSFIKDVIGGNIFYSLLYHLIIGIIGCITILLIFVFNEFFIRKQSIVNSVKNSIKNVGGKFLYIAITLICIRISLAALSLAASYGYILLTKYLIARSWKINTNIYIIFGIIRVLTSIFIFMRFVILVTLIRYFIYNTYYEMNKEICDKWEVPDKINVVTKKRSVKKLLIAAYIFILINIIYSTFLMRNDVNPLNITSITAHRGAGYFGIENTSEAVSYAKYMGADYAEIDVQLTKDEELILLHDATFKRVCNDKRSPHDMTVSDIRKLRYLEKSNKYYESMRVPTLDEVIKIAKKNKLKLNIEIKGRDDKVIKTADKVVDFIKKNEFVDEAIVTSLNINALAEVKRLDKNISTGYIIIAANKKVLDIPYIDAVSIEQGLASRAFVDAAHERGKQVHVWTLNTEDSIEKMLEIGVDNLITDIPKDAAISKEIFEKTDPGMRKLLKFLN